MISNLVKENIKSLIPYEVKECETVAKLDANENNNVDYLLNQKIAKALMELKVNQYPDTDCCELRRILGKQLRLSPQQLLIGCGSDQIILMILQAFIGAGDKILIHTPTFGMYKISTQIVGGSTIEVPLGEDFTFDYYNFVKVMKKEAPKVVFLTNPNNPTGGVIPREQIIRIIEHANGIVVIDEAYVEFYGETVLDLVNYYPNLIVLRTLSKGYGLAGARVGYGVASKELMGILYKVKPPYNIGSLSQVAAKVCLENKEMLDRVIKEIIIERDKMADVLSDIPDIKVYKSHGNFLLCKVGKAKEVYQHLADHKVLVRYFGEEGPLKGCIRITIGTKEENQLVVKLLMEALGVTKEIAV
ncbi:histidinol-phosphate transaminase [Clostridium formicaceticum]|uniref:Histidinol-phosphate aminotransferase n=2 Tax=Clostridium formicaceticum TaxID=1497 RepID=A0AAC9RFM3_9CLOT|nr:histidinol-phosphate transaminase [Clostridium formicaceticum]AOY78263.1 histidinol-phosphate transaminase [Clostridium formicaceticum]ARE85851.1 Histidinol-phosphate aminotransferase 2 [Clostridium formicaceticum]